MDQMNDLQKERATLDRTSDRDLVVHRIFNGPPRIIFAAWTTPELLQRWWVPKSTGMTLISCEVDARTGGTYRFEFLHKDFPQPVAFFGRYIEVTAPSRLVWTNEESEDGAITTVTFTDQGGKTLLELQETYSSKGALEAAIQSGEAAQGWDGGPHEQFDQLDDLLASLGDSAT